MDDRITNLPKTSSSDENLNKFAVKQLLGISYKKNYCNKLHDSKKIEWFLINNFYLRNELFSVSESFPFCDPFAQAMFVGSLDKVAK